MKNLTLLLMIALLASCKASKSLPTKKSAYFESVITYTIDYRPNSDQFSSEQIKELIGSKMVLQFKEGNYTKKYYAPNGQLLTERYLNIDENKSYVKSFRNDTIYWFDVSRNDSKATFKRIQDSLILGHPTIGVATETIVSGPGFGDQTYKTTGAFYFAQDLKVDTSWYRNYKEANFNEIIKIGQGIQLMYINRIKYWEQVITAVSIEPKYIDLKELRIQLDENSILKEL